MATPDTAARFTPARSLAARGSCALAAMLALAAAAHAQTIYAVDATAHCFVPPGREGLMVELPAGLYTTTPVEPTGPGVFAAWNAWSGSVSGCDAGGYRCSTGWITNHTIGRSDETPMATTPLAGEVAMTPALALLRPRRIVFRARDGQPLLLGVADSLCSDNVGGLTILVEPAACPADLDLDGVATLFDFLAFQNLFDAGNLVADFDDDGSLTLFDFLAFQNAFDMGC